MSKRIGFIPSRLVGPFPPGMAEDTAELMLDDPSLKQDLIEFMRGEFYPDELLYRIQITMENTAKRIENASPEEFAEWKAGPV